MKCYRSSTGQAHPQGHLCAHWPHSKTR